MKSLRLTTKLLILKEKIMANFSDLIGKTLTAINKTDERIEFVTDQDETFAMFHVQDCCESVTVEDIAGDINDLIGTPILYAAESNSSNENYNESSTWTFYNIATIKGHVTIRWYGNSNGYYSESVEFAKM